MEINNKNNIEYKHPFYKRKLVKEMITVMLPNWFWTIYSHFDWKQDYVKNPNK